MNISSVSREVELLFTNVTEEKLGRVFTLSADMLHPECAQRQMNVFLLALARKLREMKDIYQGGYFVAYGSQIFHVQLDDDHLLTAEIIKTQWEIIVTEYYAQREIEYFALSGALYTGEAPIGPGMVLEMVW